MKKISCIKCQPPLITSIFSCIFSLCSGVEDPPEMWQRCFVHSAYPVPQCSLLLCWAEKADGGLEFFEPLVQYEHCTHSPYRKLFLREPHRAYKLRARQPRLNRQNNERGWGCLNWRACCAEGSLASTCSLVLLKGKTSRTTTWAHRNLKDASSRCCRSHLWQPS